jgi:hypothetical protein
MRLQPGQTVFFERVSENECRLLVRLSTATPDPMATLGFAKRHGLPAASTTEWMRLLREGEKA